LPGISSQVSPYRTQRSTPRPPRASDRPRRLDRMAAPSTAGPGGRRREGSLGSRSTDALRFATLDEVALRAGVSRSVASRAMNNARNVSAPKREAVARAASELGYVPNA